MKHSKHTENYIKHKDSLVNYGKGNTHYYGKEVEHIKHPQLPLYFLLISLTSLLSSITVSLNFMILICLHFSIIFSPKCASLNICFSDISVYQWTQYSVYSFFLLFKFLVVFVLCILVVTWSCCLIIYIAVSFFYV